MGACLAAARREKGLTAAELATKCTEIGLPISRSKIANMEHGRARQEGISVAEVHVLAEALGVPPITLLFPVYDGGTVEALPGSELDAWAAYRWFCGDVIFTLGMRPVRPVAGLTTG